MNRSILCNCRIEAENNFLLESLATCHETNAKLIMYFTVNNAFTNYLNEFNLMEEVEIPILTNKSTSEITLPVFLNKSTFDKTLLSAPLTLCKTANSIHLFKITGKIMMEKVKLNKHYIHDILEIAWSEVKVTFNGKVINLPKSISVRLWHKFKVRQMMGSQPILFHLMLKQGFNWFALTQENQEIDEIQTKQ